MASLSLAANKQLPGLTGRRFKMPTDAALMSQIPAARSVEQDRLTNKYRLDALKQNQDQFDQSKRQSQEQFDADQRLKQDLGKKQEDDSKTAGYTQLANTALTGAALIGKDNLKAAGTKMLDILSPSKTPPIEAAPTYAPSDVPLPTETPYLEPAAPLEGEYISPGEYYGLEETGTGGAEATAGSETAGTSISGVLAYIAAAEIARGLWGGQGIPYEEKTNWQKAADSPGTIAATPWAAFAKSGTVADTSQKNMSNFERLAMAPIDYLFAGDYSNDSLAAQEDLAKDRIKIAGDALWRPLGDSDNKWTQTGNFIMNPIAGVAEMFCFLPGTPIIMADGTIKPVEEIDLLDDCYGGGVVNAKGVTLAEDIYDYEGVGVTGSHAVYEDDVWIRVRDSQKGKYTPPAEAQKVYIINNMRHQLWVNDIIFADYGEVTDSDDMTSQERLDWMNANSNPTPLRFGDNSTNQF